MGSEQSSQSNGPDSSSKNPKLKRGKSVPESSWPRSSQDGQHSRAASASTSPGHNSVCSDVDLPYVSYTVNRPIGGNATPDAVVWPSAFDAKAANRGSSGMRLSTPKYSVIETKIVLIAITLMK